MNQMNKKASSSDAQTPPSFDPDDLVQKATVLAHSMGHGYMTVVHLLSVYFVDHRQAQDDFSEFLSKSVPKRERGHLLSQTQGFSRVYKRMCHGMSLVEAVMQEDDEAFGPYFVKKHNLHSVE